MEVLENDNYSDINNINDINDINDINNINKKYNFIHFDSIENCNKFILLFGVKNVIHKCCNGKGFKYLLTENNKNLILEIENNINRKDKNNEQNNEQINE